MQPSYFGSTKYRPKVCCRKRFSPNCFKHAFKLSASLLSLVGVGKRIGEWLLPGKHMINNHSQLPARGNNSDRPSPSISQSPEKIIEPALAISYCISRISYGF